MKTPIITGLTAVAVLAIAAGCSSNKVDTSPPSYSSAGSNQTTGYTTDNRNGTTGATVVAATEPVDTSATVASATPMDTSTSPQPEAISPEASSQVSGFAAGAPADTASTSTAAEPAPRADRN